MKLLSVAIPSYNSEKYMEKCIKSLLVGGEDVEILIINDGSKDGTAEIAEKWAKRFPTIIRAIHQENKGHGGAVNTGIEHAAGLYFKVVDSDDWVGKDAFLKVLDQLRELTEQGRSVDMMISNFVYDKQGASRKKIMHYRHILPAGKIFGWEDVGAFPPGKYLLMHALIYRTQVLRDCGLKLPEHTFYVDNIFAFDPFPHVSSMYYLDVNMYHYFIGRDDQSVNETVMIGRIDQQIRVNKWMTETYVTQNYSHKKIRKYMYRYLEIITTISSIMLLVSGTEENLAKKEELWRYLKEADGAFYRRLRFGLFGIMLNLPGKAGRWLAVSAYRIAQKLYGFN